MSWDDRRSKEMLREATRGYEYILGTSQRCVIILAQHVSVCFWPIVTNPHSITFLHPSIAMHRYASLCIAMHRYASLCIAMHRYASLCIAMHRYASLCIAMHRYASLCIAMHRYASLCIAMHRYASLCIAMHRYASVCHVRCQCYQLGFALRVQWGSRPRPTLQAHLQLGRHHGPLLSLPRKCNWQTHHTYSIIFIHYLEINCILYIYITIESYIIVIDPPWQSTKTKLVYSYAHYFQLKGLQDAPRVVGCKYQPQPAS